MVAVVAAATEAVAAAVDAGTNHWARKRLGVQYLEIHSSALATDSGCQAGDRPRQGAGGGRSGLHRMERGSSGSDRSDPAAAAGAAVAESYFQCFSVVIRDTVRKLRR